MVENMWLGCQIVTYDNVNVILWTKYHSQYCIIWKFEHARHWQLPFNMGQTFNMGQLCDFPLCCGVESIFLLEYTGKSHSAYFGCNKWKTAFFTSDIVNLILHTNSDMFDKIFKTTTTSSISLWFRKFVWLKTGETRLLTSAFDILTW